MNSQLSYPRCIRSWSIFSYPDLYELRIRRRWFDTAEWRRRRIAFNPRRRRGATTSEIMISFLILSTAYSSKAIHSCLLYMWTIVAPWPLYQRFPRKRICGRNIRSIQPHCNRRVRWLYDIAQRDFEVWVYGSSRRDCMKSSEQIDMYSKDYVVRNAEHRRSPLRHDSILTLWYDHTILLAVKTVFNLCNDLTFLEAMHQIKTYGKWIGSIVVQLDAVSLSCSSAHEKEKRNES